MQIKLFPHVLDVQWRLEGCNGKNARLTNYYEWFRVSMGAPFTWPYANIKRKSLVNCYLTFRWNLLIPFKETRVTMKRCLFRGCRFRGGRTLKVLQFCSLFNHSWRENNNCLKKQLYRYFKWQTKEIAYEMTYTWIRRGNLKRETESFDSSTKLRRKNQLSQSKNW